MNVYSILVKARAENKKLLAVLIDPDLDEERLHTIAALLAHSAVDLCLIGGSLLHRGRVDSCIEVVKSYVNVPIVLFPGNEIQVCNHADALLFLSLISGRNADLLIGKHVVAAPFLPSSGLEVISCGYMLVDGGKQTTASYISQTMPLPADKPDIAVATALAGYYLGNKLLYLDAGSGANHAVSATMVAAVSANVNLPLIVGGGIRSTEAVRRAWDAGADMVVIGNSIENNPEFLRELNTLKK